MKPTTFFDEIIAETSKHSDDLLDWLIKKYFLKFSFGKNPQYETLHKFLNQRVQEMIFSTKQEITSQYAEVFPKENPDFLYGKEEYLEPIIAFLFVYYLWIKSENDEEIVKNFDDIYYSVILGTVSYGIIDTYCDNRLVADENFYFSLQLITEYEHKILNAYGLSKSNFDLLLKLKTILHRFEYKEKLLVFKKSPYNVQNISECGLKASHLFYPLGLFLIKRGWGDKVDIFYKIYLNCSAVIQIFDDIGDVESDVKNGHYSFPILLLNKDNRDNVGYSTQEIVKNESLMKTIKECLLELILECETLEKEHNLPIFPFPYLVQALKARILLIF